MPFIPLLQCDGPECSVHASAQFTPESGWAAPGWRAYDNHIFCSHGCVARYATGQYAHETEQLAREIAQQTNGSVDDLQDLQRGDVPTMNG